MHGISLRDMKAGIIAMRREAERLPEIANARGRA